MILHDRKTYSITVDNVDVDSASGLNREDILLSYSNLELLHAALTTTFPSARLTPSYRDKSRLELIWRMTILESGLMVRDDRLFRSEDAMYLSDAERSSISHYIGLIYTRMIAEKLLSTGCLVSINLLPVNGKSAPLRYGGLYRADLIGYNYDDHTYDVVESVGRTENSMAAFTDACRSSAELLKINREKPSGASVVMTYYEKGALTATIADATKLLDLLEAQRKDSLPEEIPSENPDQYEFAMSDGSDSLLITIPGRTEKPASSKAARRRRAGMTISFTEKEYFDAYYRPVFELMTAEHPEYLWDDQKNCYETELELPHFKRNNEISRRIIVGMSPQLFSCIKEGDYSRVSEAAAFSRAYKHTGKSYCGRDGIWIRMK